VDYSGRLRTAIVLQFININISILNYFIILLYLLLNICLTHFNHILQTMNALWDFFILLNILINILNVINFINIFVIEISIAHSVTGLCSNFEKGRSLIIPLRR